MAGPLLEAGWLSPSGHKMRDAAAGSILAAGLFPASADGEQCYGCGLGNFADGTLSCVFCAEFAGPGGSACCRTDLLGIRILFPQTHWRSRYLVFAGGASERDSDSSAAGAAVMGSLEP